MQRRMVKSPCNRCKEKEAARNAHHGRPGRRLSERAPRPDPLAPKGEMQIMVACMHACSVPHSVLALIKAAEPLNRLTANAIVYSHAGAGVWHAWVGRGTCVVILCRPLAYLPCLVGTVA